MKVLSSKTFTWHQQTRRNRRITKYKALQMGKKSKQGPGWSVRATRGQIATWHSVTASVTRRRRRAGELRDGLFRTCSCQVHSTIELLERRTWIWYQVSTIYQNKLLCRDVWRYIYICVYTNEKRAILGMPAIPFSYSCTKQQHWAICLLNY